MWLLEVHPPPPICNLPLKVGERSTTARIESAAEKKGLLLQFIHQSPNSPDQNVNDLGFFTSLDKETLKIVVAAQMDRASTHPNHAHASEETPNSPPKKPPLKCGLKVHQHLLLEI